jgi:hypothetical protein
MNVKEIRRRNLQKIAREIGGVTKLAGILGKSQSQISHLIGLNHVKNIGDKLAAEIEIAFKMAPGDLDVLQDIDFDRLKDIDFYNLKKDKDFYNFIDNIYDTLSEVVANGTRLIRVLNKGRRNLKRLKERQ